MTDRELLEAAARAAGSRSYPEAIDDRLGLSWGEGWWNPLANDGDALRLAVKLRMRVHHDGSCGTAELPTGQKYCWTEAAVVESNDPYVATRRAIVRAAAAMAPKP